MYFFSIYNIYIYSKRNTINNLCIYSLDIIFLIWKFEVDCFSVVDLGFWKGRALFFEGGSGRREKPLFKVH